MPDNEASSHPDTNGTNVALAGRIAALRAEIGHVRELLTQRMDQEQLAVEVQAAEYARRLEVLNHAHEYAREKETEFVSRAEQELQIREIEKRIESNTNLLIGLNGVTGDLKALFTWKDEVAKGVIKIEALSVEVKGLTEFKYDVANWRSKVMGMAMGIGGVCGVLGGLISAAVGHMIK
jgi:hypothetical protein